MHTLNPILLKILNSQVDLIKLLLQEDTPTCDNEDRVLLQHSDSKAIIFITLFFFILTGKPKCNCDKMSIAFIANLGKTLKQ